MAIAQMEAVVSDPSQLMMAADQMRNMSEGNLKRRWIRRRWRGIDFLAKGEIPCVFFSALFWAKLRGKKVDIQQSTAWLVLFFLVVSTIFSSIIT
jgi:hypothetical protein